MNSLLCISAHPDDEVLSFGALLMWAARLGWKIHFAWATVGEKSRSLAASSRWQELPHRAVRSNIANAVDLLLHIARVRGKRELVEVLEIASYDREGDEYRFNAFSEQ